MAVGVVDEGGAGTGLGLVTRLLHDAVVVDCLKRRVDAFDAHRNVAVAVLVRGRLLALRLGQLELAARLVRDVHVPRLPVCRRELSRPLEPQLLDVLVGRPVRVGHIRTCVENLHE